MTPVTRREGRDRRANNHELAWLTLDSLLLVASAAGFLLVVYRDAILPARFFYDGQRIQGIAQGFVDSYGDASYGVVASIYRVVGLANNDLAASLVGYATFVVGIIAVRILCRQATPSLTVIVMTPIAVFLGAIYLGFYSKDVFVLSVVFLVLLLPVGRKFDVILLATMCLYALNFRQYWWVIAVLYLGLRVVRNVTRDIRVTILACLGALAVVALCFYFVLGLDADHFRTAANVLRGSNEDAASAIPRFVTLAEPVGGLANVVLTWFALLVPLPLAALGGLYYVTLALVITGIWFAFFRPLAGKEAANEMTTRSDRRERCISLVLAFTTTQALFEPDYGSVLRHLTPLLLLVLYVAWISVSPRHEILGCFEASSETPRRQLSR